MEITYDRLHALALTDDRTTTTALAGPLQAQLADWTPLRAWHFLAQTCFESEFYRRFIENLNYRPDIIADRWPRLSPRANALAHNPEALANAAYASYVDDKGETHDPLGNGAEGNGNGWAYRGRGLIQITGRWNYSHFATRTGIDIFNTPDLAAVADNAVRLAISFWTERDCDEAADRDDVAGVTLKINGGENGLADRKVLTTRAKTLFT